MQEQYDTLPTRYSQELKNLITAMLLKEDRLRPTTSEILGMPLVQKHVAALVQTGGEALTTTRAFERQATATAHIQDYIPIPGGVKKMEPEDKKEKPMSEKERVKKKKEDETKKRIELMTTAAKGAHKQMAEYNRSINM